MPRDPYVLSPEDMSQSRNVNENVEEAPRISEVEPPFAMSHEDVDYATGVMMSTPFRSRINPRPKTQRDHLHPFSQILTVSNVEDCVQVEDAAFPPNERCSREKFIYRLTKCPELSLGLFSLPVPRGKDSRPAPTLLAHIVATQTLSDTVTDASMGYPEDWQSPNPKPPGNGSEPLGHQVKGKTIAIHSLAVLPTHQRKGLGKTLMRAYIQRMDDAKTADRLVLIAHEDLIPYYEDLGFESKGKSKATFGGGGWYDMVYEFNETHFGDDIEEEE